MWIVPRTRGLEPNYGSASTEPSARRNRWAHLVTDNASAKGDAPVRIDQDVNLYVAEIDPKTTLPFELREGRQLYFLCLEGQVTLGHQSGQASMLDSLEAHEAAELSGEQRLEVSAQDSGAHCLLLEMAASG
jgi:redox-sensitive bicupin YhaK (pirin superfamily)